LRFAVGCPVNYNFLQVKNKHPLRPSHISPTNNKTMGACLASSQSASALPYWLEHASRGRDFTLDKQVCVGKVVDVYDGDTVRVVFMPAGFSAPVQMVARMAGYDSAELKQSKADPPAERDRKRALAVAARDYLAALVLHKVVRITCGPFDKYGRVLVTLNVVLPSASPSASASSVNDLMVAQGFGKPYNGRTSKPRH
jgi:endonuclease YncB( thermonuclease family)